MLTALSIRDVVLIDRLDLEVEAGLGVFTGETGAGKSILLDSLSLALGARANTGLVRKGADQLSVSAAFDLPAPHPALGLLRELDLLEPDNAGGNGTDSPGELFELVTVRRVVTAEGRSRAYVNDRPTSVGVLKQLGDALVEIHGQFESHALLDPTRHRGVLDRYTGGTPAEMDSPAEALSALKSRWKAWRDARKARETAEADLARARAEEDSLRHLAGELEALAPQPGEEDTLAAERALLMNGEKLREGLSGALSALSEPTEVEGALHSAIRSLDRIRDLMGSSETLAGVIDGLDRALVEVTEAQAGLDHLGSEIDLDPRRQEQVEERLFALRALARKQGVTVEDLPELAERTSAALEALDGSGDHVVALAKAESAARHDYLEAARHLSRIRKAAATALDQAVAAELPPLKLDKARFFTEVAELPESEWGPDGLDQVTFLVATNPGSDPGPIHRIASGGELARFMLALKVVLADADTVPTLVFDEVDMGIGGATAAAVGERLARLGKGLQVLVVTHSPQVAAVGIHHWRVSKSETAPGVTGSRVDPLSPEQRREEVARMLAGAEVTSEARAAADRLLAAAHS